jgi:NhaA family Na+:H+ antiporter
VLSLLGPRVPASLKVFLAALAILDDLGAVAIIAVFYAGDLSLPDLGLAAAALAALAALNRFGVSRLSPYMLVGALLWFFVLRSGVHATIAGVALALTIPLRLAPGRPDDVAGSPLHRLEHRLHGWVAFGIVPLFGFANAGVSFAGVTADALLDPSRWASRSGCSSASWWACSAPRPSTIRAGLADVPMGASWPQLVGVALLCGIGFTMSLFIGLLAFADDPRSRTR